MGVSGGKAKKAAANSVLTERQQKWFASVEASLERDTGKSIVEWVKIAKKCPETAPRKRAQWFRDKYGLGVNRIAHIVSVAFPGGPSWDEPDALLDQLWKEKDGRAIYEAVVKLVRKEFPEAVIGPRKTFVSFSRKVQFAGILPSKVGKAEIGLPLPVSASKRLEPMKRRPWAEKHSGLLVLYSPKDVDAEVKRLLTLAWAKGA
ncbi:hypothetical protein ATE48_16955 [Candidatus Viadribacter manganicus]|uniref:DUF5655 domain-containing protein n=1 Tax=Candidatus Viadribacter manganicus TaxID=1759059 RepID=A0A1B1ALP9_9PROT|nr:hypothetical protein ATE48_16955 [Candidatus Viadribacter manganicus]